ncbi:MAG: HDOD domain-containing protein [Anaerolineae bacterium]
MSRTPVELPAVLRQLPPLPAVLSRALELTRDHRSRRSDLAKVLSLDQGMTGYFLQMVNSAYYGLPRRITSLDEAIGYLGYETVEEVIFAMSASKTLARPVPAYLLEQQMLWQHSVAVAEGSDWVARERGIEPRSEAYVAGLLHDVGKLAVDLMLHREPGWGRAAGDEENQETWTEVERRVTGSDHAEVGAVIVRSWNLPDRVVEAVACHHNPCQAELDPSFAAVVHVANVAALMAGIGLGVDGLRYVLDEGAVSRLEWNEGDMMALIEQMQGAVERAERMLKLKP